MNFHAIRRWWYRQWHKRIGMAIINNEFGIIPDIDQVIILEDKFKSGYECSKCGGDCYLDAPCDFCKGTGKENMGSSGERLCRMCCPINLIQSMGTQPGKKLCDVCEGRGGLLIAPEMSQRRPTSGVIKAMGSDVMMHDLEDRALYSMFAGTAINFKQRGTIRIMHEHEIMGVIVGTGKLGDFTR